MSSSFTRTRYNQGPRVYDGTKIGVYEYRVGQVWQKGFDISLPNYAFPLEYYNACQDVTNPGPPYHSGGGLGVTHAQYGGDKLTGARTLQKGTSRYVTQFYVVSMDGNDPTSPATWPSLADLATYGSIGWNKFRPAKPKVELGVFLAELRDFNRLFATRISQLTDLRGFSNYYLAYQFGWVPILNDLRKAYTTYRDCARIMKRLLSKNGKYEKRGGTVATGGDTFVLTPGLTVQPGISSTFLPGYTYTYTPVNVSREYKIWFEGALRYFIPNLGDKYTDINVYRKLFGLTVSPAVVYELIPWSWCVDWFTNLGDCLQNLDSVADTTNAAYAFVMRTQKVVKQAAVTQRYLCDGGDVTVTVPFHREWTKKERCVASPFSPGLTDELLTLRQLTILGALGVQRFSKW